MTSPDGGRATVLLVGQHDGTCRGFSVPLLLENGVPAGSLQKQQGFVARFLHGHSGDIKVHTLETHLSREGRGHQNKEKREDQERLNSLVR